MQRLDGHPRSLLRDRTVGVLAKLSSFSHLVDVFVLGCYRLRMPSPVPPPNFRDGLKRASAVRTARSEELGGETWVVVLALASGLKRVAYDPAERKIAPVELVTPPKTLAEFADALNDLGRRTSRGTLWSAQTLQRVFKAHDATPKKLRELLLPQPFREPIKLPFQTDLFGTLRLLTQRENEHGVWMASVIRSPRPLDWVRLRVASEDEKAGAIFSVRERTRSGVLVTDYLGERQALRLVDLETWTPKRIPRE